VPTAAAALHAGGRLTGVQFSILVGEEVPRSVHFHRLPARIVEYAPQYCDFDYILVGDDILIVDPSTHGDLR
jgi:hypothetical protein